MSIRQIATHLVEGQANELTIEVLDQPTHGNACHRYQVTDTDGKGAGVSLDIHFQEGPIKEHGVNGVSHEVLLAVVKDRLEGFQTGPFACEENGLALAHIDAALAMLKGRTAKRLARGVEGTSKQ